MLGLGTENQTQTNKKQQQTSTDNQTTMHLAGRPYLLQNVSQRCVVLGGGRPQASVPVWVGVEGQAVVRHIMSGQVMGSGERGCKV